MAKKKMAEKAKIEAAPVLRSGGDDPTPETPVITKSYIMRDDWIDKGVVNTVAFKSVDGEVQDLIVNGEPAGGGGTATVSITNASNNAPFDLEMPFIDSDQYTRGGTRSLFPGATLTFIVPIGPTGCYAVFGGQGALPSSGTATGGITYDEGDVYITGNGTLTVS